MPWLFLGAAGRDLQGPFHPGGAVCTAATDQLLGVLLRQPAEHKQLLTHSGKRPVEAARVLSAL